MIRARKLLLIAGLAVALPAGLQAQATHETPKTPAMVKPKSESQEQLQKEASIPLAAATATALAAVPGGKVESHELEREKGKLIYSFDIKVAGKSGIDEVAVDAKTGMVIDKSHETPADEAKEAAADKKAATKKPAGPPVKKP